MKHKRRLIVEIVGWLGMMAILGAYLLVSFKVLTTDMLLYQILNLGGAIGVVVVSAAKGAKQPAILNVLWAIVAVVAIVRMIV